MKTPEVAASGVFSLCRLDTFTSFLADAIVTYAISSFKYNHFMKEYTTVSIEERLKDIEIVG